MADLKISQLTGATTPLAGTEVLPIVQSSTTKKVSVADLTAGRSVSMADATLSTGNLVIGTSGKGIDFSATPGTGTSELLNDYEEGTWTVTWTSLTGTPANTTGYYIKIGSAVYFTYSTGVSTISGTQGSLGFTLPTTPGQVAAFMQFQNGVSAQQIGESYTNAKAYVRTFTAVNDELIFSGFYFA